MEHGFAAICVWDSDADSMELVERAPLPPLTGSTNLKKRTTHLHLGPGGPREAPLRNQVAVLTEMLETNSPAFREYRRLATFHLAIEWHYQESFELVLDLPLLRALARLRCAVDMDLWWIDDEHYIEAVDDSHAYYYGELFVAAPPHREKWTSNARKEIGRHVVPLLRDAPRGAVLEFDIRGGIGRPYTHFSSNAVHAAAANDSALRVTVRPTARSRAPVPAEPES